MNEPRKPGTPIVVETEQKGKRPKPDTNRDCCCAAGCFGLIGVFGILLAIGVFRRLIDFAFGG